jgi:hypothetical protein
VKSGSEAKISWKSKKVLGKAPVLPSFSLHFWPRLLFEEVEMIRASIKVPEIMEEFWDCSFFSKLKFLRENLSPNLGIEGGNERMSERDGEEERGAEREKQSERQTQRKIEKK